MVVGRKHPDQERVQNAELGGSHHADAAVKAAGRVVPGRRTFVFARPTLHGKLRGQVDTLLPENKHAGQVLTTTWWRQDERDDLKRAIKAGKGTRNSTVSGGKLSHDEGATIGLKDWAAWRRDAGRAPVQRRDPDPTLILLPN